MPNPWAQQTTTRSSTSEAEAHAIAEALGMTYLGGIGALRDIVNNMQAEGSDSNSDEDSDAVPEEQVYVPLPDVMPDGSVWIDYQVWCP